MKKINLFVILLAAILMPFLIISCDNEINNPSTGDEDNTGDGSTKDFVYTETGMYLGITGFSDEINFYGSSERRYETLGNSHSYESFINSLSMGDATVLYYAVDNNLSYLEKCQFPNDVSSVSIITFTDGLDQGSRALDKQDQNNSYAADSKSYVEAIAEKLQRIKVNNLPINAYAIGVRGSDVQGDAVATFENNLLKLSSSPENAMQVSNMDEVNAKFEAIAKSLYSKTETRSLNITIPMPSEKEKERFTFDNVTDPTKSTCYLEGVYAGGALNDIQYVGCQSSSGAKVLETSAGGVKIQFLFENFTDLNGNAISTNNMQQWHMNEGETTWTRNSEFKPTESINVEETRTSAVVMLILDCSSSLGASDFSKVKTAAKNFIKNLAGEVNDNSGDDDDENDDDPNKNDPEPEITNYYIKHSWGSGLDADWAWQQMYAENDSYVYSGLWGGIGANINTTESDAGALWFSESNIEGAYSLYIGDEVKFIYEPNTGILSVTKISSGNQGNTAQVRFCKEQAYEYVTLMTIWQVPGGGTGSFETVASHDFGTSAGVSPYYEINAQLSFPGFYYAYDNEYYFAFGDENPEYIFEAGYKYTYNCGDDGDYLVFSIIVDASFNAPARVIATRRVHKNELHTLKKTKL